MEKELTIVIPCKNEEENIGRLLEELSLQRVGSTEIILADANSTDGTVQEAKNTALELGLKLRVAPGGLPGKGRNQGAFFAKTEYILFIDADVTFTNKFDLGGCLEKIKNGRYDLLSTTPIYRGDKNLRASLMFFLNKIGTIVLSKSDPFAIGAFTLVRTERFREIGGYNEDLKHTEDWVFSKNISPSKFILIPDLITQDDRRFRKFGYWNMLILVFKNWKNRKNLSHFEKEVGYWNHY
jgi:glycosyltransferase involved in cell wall biosynthesis